MNNYRIFIVIYVFSFYLIEDKLILIIKIVLIIKSFLSAFVGCAADSWIRGTSEEQQWELDPFFPLFNGSV